MLITDIFPHAISNNSILELTHLLFEYINPNWSIMREQKVLKTVVQSREIMKCRRA